MLAVMVQMHPQALRAVAVATTAAAVAALVAIQFQEVADQVGFQIHRSPRLRIQFPLL